jgi:hypothetical protein
MSGIMVLLALHGCGDTKDDAANARDPSKDKAGLADAQDAREDLTMEDFVGFWRMNVEATERQILTGPGSEAITRRDEVRPTVEQMARELTYEVFPDFMISRRNDRSQRIELEFVSTGPDELIMFATLENGMQANLTFRLIDGKYLQIDDGVPMSLNMFIMERAGKPGNL